MSFVELIGYAACAITIFKLLHYLVNFFYVSYIGHALGHTPVYKKLGQWVVVTGATDGIGKAYATEFAKLGMDIVLISRTEAKLASLAEELRGKHGVAVDYIQMNFVEGEAAYSNIRQKLNKLDIAVLVNNVGMNYDHPEYFTETSRENFFENILHCNCLSTTVMMQIVLPAMVQKRRGVVLNVSSIAARLPGPLLATYSATKSYVSKLSEALHTELADSGVIVQCIEPAFVCSNMSRISRPSLFVPTAEQFVRAQLRSVGLTAVTFGCPSHRVQGRVCDLAMATAQPAFAAYYKNRMIGVKQRALKRKQDKTE